MVSKNGKSIRMVYCHSDGYLKYNGRILLEHYQDPDKINQLLDLGDLSELGPEIGEKWNFNEWPAKPGHENWTRAYGRDRGEKGVKARTYKVEDKPLQSFLEQEYLYLWKDGAWWYSDHGSEMKLLTKKAIVGDS
jgi:hypothetical protein